MTNPVARQLRIAANTSSSTEAFARRTNEISRFISGIGRQNIELEKQISGDMSLCLVKTHPELEDFSHEGPISRFTLPLERLLGTKNPNSIYRKSKTLDELKDHFEPLIEELGKVVHESDVVLLGGTYFVPWCLLQAARRHQKPTVLCYAGILSMEITHLPDEIQMPLKLMEKDFYDPKLFYIFPSELTKRTVEGIFGRTLPHSEVIFNGVPSEFLAIDGPEKRETTIAFVGRNTHVKNPEFLLALKKSLERLHRPYNLAMVTGIDPGNRLIRDLRKAGVAVLEPLDTAELARFYRSISLVVSPSRFETFGNVPLECISCGTPALISPNMGVGEVFRHFGLGSYVADFSDPDKITQRIEPIISGEERIPQSLRERIKDELGWPKVIGRYLDLCLRAAFG
jgi:glycosyltransferase involved in cell wall biosynthesis